jgi:hypothetical protein
LSRPISLEYRSLAKDSAQSSDIAEPCFADRQPSPACKSNQSLAVTWVI